MLEGNDPFTNLFFSFAVCLSFQLSLRDNPLVVRFVKDMTLNPPSLLELAGRTVKTCAIRYGPEDLPRMLIEYLQTANCCVNPNCKGKVISQKKSYHRMIIMNLIVLLTLFLSQ